MEDITLKKLVDNLCGRKKELSLLKYYLKRTLRNTGYANLSMNKASAIEIQDGFVTVVFTRDMIYAINNFSCITTDLNNPTTAFEVFD